MWQLHDIKARVVRLDELTRPLRKEIVAIAAGDDPLLYLELQGVHGGPAQAAAGLDEVVLAQTASGPKGLFNLCVADDASFRDLELSVAFKAVRGDIDRGGGLVWRYQDNDNYYLVRMNPLEDNFRVYKVVGGKRRQLGTKEDLKAPSGEWHVITVSQGATRSPACWTGRNTWRSRTTPSRRRARWACGPRRTPKPTSTA